MTNLIIALNADTQDLAYNSSGVDWVDVDLDNDSLIFTGGSDVVKDGDPIPSASELTQAGILLTGSQQTVALHLLADISANELKEIHNMGDQDKRYVMAFDFDGPTASEPVLEAWDNDSLNSINNVSLGAGVATSSWLRGVVTTDGLPGASWTGQRLAGASDGHFLKLNNDNGALSVAKTLYCNLKLVIPAVQTAGINETPILICKYATN